MCCINNHNRKRDGKPVSAFAGSSTCPRPFHNACSVLQHYCQHKRQNIYSPTLYILQMGSPIDASAFRAPQQAKFPPLGQLQTHSTPSQTGDCLDMRPKGKVTLISSHLPPFCFRAHLSQLFWQRASTPVAPLHFRPHKVCAIRVASLDTLLPVLLHLSSSSVPPTPPANPHCSGKTACFGGPHGKCHHFGLTLLLCTLLLSTPSTAASMGLPSGEYTDCGDGFCLLC